MIFGKDSNFGYWYSFEPSLYEIEMMGKNDLEEYLNDSLDFNISGVNFMVRLKCGTEDVEVRFTDQLDPSNNGI